MPLQVNVQFSILMKANVQPLNQRCRQMSSVGESTLTRGIKGSSFKLSFYVVFFSCNLSKYQMNSVSCTGSTICFRPIQSMKFHGMYAQCTLTKKIVQNIDMGVVYNGIGQFINKTSPSLCNRPKSSRADSAA